MAAHKGPASSRSRCTRSGSSVAAVPVYLLPLYSKWQKTVQYRNGLLLPRIGNKVIKMHRQGCTKAHLYASFSQQRQGSNHRTVHVELMSGVGPEQGVLWSAQYPLPHQCPIPIYLQELVQQAHLKMQYQGTQPHSTLKLIPVSSLLTSCFNYAINRISNKLYNAVPYAPSTCTIYLHITATHGQLRVIAMYQLQQLQFFFTFQISCLQDKSCNVPDDVLMLSSDFCCLYWSQDLQCRG
jgi:hypothetical protein